MKKVDFTRDDVGRPKEAKIAALKSQIRALCLGCTYERVWGLDLVCTKAAAECPRSGAIGLYRELERLSHPKIKIVGADPRKGRLPHIKK